MFAIGAAAGHRDWRKGGGYIHHAQHCAAEV